MDELNINNLPAEILTEVFRYLNVGDLKNATMACKLWNNLIESTFRWSLELKYNSHDRLISKSPDDTKRKMNFILTTNRKFGTIKIDGGRLNEDHLIFLLFKRHGFNVVELHLFGCRIDKLTGLAEVLNFTPNLKHVVVDIEISHGSSGELLTDKLLPDLKKLESLEFNTIRGGDYRIIKCFRKAKVTTMEIRGFMPLSNGCLMADFLSTQDKLTTLTVDTHSPSILIEIGKLNVPFQLKQLSISDTIICQKPSQGHDYLMRFIESQAGDLREIEIKYDISSSVYDCVFANMTKLTTLSVNVNYLPWNIDFYERLAENCSVHTLKLRSHGKGGIELVSKFFQKLPNIRCLILRNTNDVSNNGILVMAQCFSKLESLFIEQFNGTLDGVQFPNLKTLRIRNFEGKINCNEFTKAHPLLTELAIERKDYYSCLTSDDVDQSMTNDDLQQIGPGADAAFDNGCFDPSQVYASFLW